jgi:energy-coupling factor transport system permease protein
MNPRALAAWSAAALLMALSSGDPVYRGAVLLCGLNLVLARGRRGPGLRGLLIGVGVAAATSTLVRLPAGIPAIGGALTLEAIAFGLATGLGIAAATLAVAPLALVCEPHELVDALPAALARTGVAVGAALNLIPGTLRSAAEIRDAQRMRGWRARRIGDWPALAVPVVLTAVESSLTLAEAMEARAYGSGRRTHLRVARWGAADTLVVLSAAVAALLFLALRLTGLAPDWYPFPSLSAPPVSLPALLCCAALVVPSLRRGGAA